MCDFLKLIHVQLAARAVLLEALVPVHDLLVGEGRLLSEQGFLRDRETGSKTKCHNLLVFLHLKIPALGPAAPQGRSCFGSSP